MKKLMMFVVLSVMAAAGAAEVIFDGSKAAAWSSKRISDGSDGILTVAVGYPPVKSKEFIPVETGKTYVVSGEFRVVEPTDNKALRLYFGFIPSIEEGREISHLSVVAVSPAIAELAKDVKAGDRSVVLKNAENWKFDQLGRLAFNAKSDRSDMPNFDLSAAFDRANIKVNADGTVEVPFQKPFTKAYPAGTTVRQHRAGNSYIYIGVGKKYGEWMTFSCRVTQFYTGTAKIKVAFNVNVAKCKLEMRNVKVTVE